MAVQTETFFNLKKVGIVFACASVALLLSMVWLVQVDYARPWRGFQDEFFDLQASLACLDALADKTPESRKTCEELSGRVRRGLVNIPLGDFVAPKGTIGRHEIRQVELPEVRRELNFVQGYQVDRCMTCHVAVADRDFTKEHLARRLERALLAANQERKSLGREELPLPRVAGRDDLKPGSIAPFWWSLSRKQQDAFFAALVDQINVYQAMQGKDGLHFAQPLRAHPDLDLFMSADSPHPMGRMGCTVCHEGNGEETDFILAAHTPRSPEQGQQWASKYGVRTSGLGSERGGPGVDGGWDRPMLASDYVEASCTKCHGLTSDLFLHDGRPTAERINEGRFLFESLGCANCHLIQELADARRVGPDLTHVGEKLTRGFMHNWSTCRKRFGRRPTCRTTSNRRTTTRCRRSPAVTRTPCCGPGPRRWQ